VIVIDLHLVALGMSCITINSIPSRHQQAEGQLNDGDECRDMPGYPKVDKESDFLIARFDGAVLDGKPWGRGALDDVPPSAGSLGYNQQQAAMLASLQGLEVSVEEIPLGFCLRSPSMHALTMCSTSHIMRRHACTRVAQH
jgi:hypothetical protein